MKIGLKFLSTLFSLIVVAILASLIFLFAYPSKNAPTDNFGIEIYCIILLLFAIVSGLALIILRFVRILRSGANFFLNFIGILNFSLGVLGIVLLFSNSLTDKFSIALFFLSFLLGIFILVDFFISKIPET